MKFQKVIQMWLINGKEEYGIIIHFGYGHQGKDMLRMGVGKFD